MVRPMSVSFAKMQDDTGGNYQMYVHDMATPVNWMAVPGPYHRKSSRE